MSRRTFEEANALRESVGAQSIMTDEERRLLYGLNAETVFEIGTAYGGTAILLAAGGAEVVTVDSWQCGPEVRALFDASVAACPPDVREQLTCIADDGATVARRIYPEGEPFDLVLVDGHHEAPSPAQDIAAALWLVRLGGYFAVDDVANGHPDITAAVFSANLEGFRFVRACREDAPCHRLTKLCLWQFAPRDT